MSRRRRQARYNTLTGTGSRDLRSQDSYKTLGERNGSELGSSIMWNQQADCGQLGRGDGGSLATIPVGTGLEGHQGAAQSAASWLQQGAMIPRVDSSTLRRQARWLADQTAATSIVEETVEQDNDGHEAGAIGQTSAL